MVQLKNKNSQEAEALIKLVSDVQDKIDDIKKSVQNRSAALAEAKANAVARKWPTMKQKNEDGTKRLTPRQAQAACAQGSGNAVPGHTG